MNRGYSYLNPMMQMMGMNADMLAAAFNAGERGRDHSNVDAVFKIGRVLNDSRNVYFEIARKTRAPSYQEAFLWLPLQATGGLLPTSITSFFAGTAHARCDDPGSRGRTRS